MPQRKAEIAALIMAAGESRRMNTPKQLLQWGKKSLIEHIIDIARQSSVDSIVVIIGSNAEKVKLVLRHYHDIRVIYNPNWRNGLGSSIQLGIKSIAGNTQGALILLADQPFVESKLIDIMIDRFKKSSASIIAPRINEMQSNPVLFKCDLFNELNRIKGDRGAKKLLSRYSVEWIKWQDNRLALDIDSQGDYQKAISLDKE